MQTGAMMGNGVEFYINQAEVSAVPLPAVSPLFAAGLGALDWLNRRRKRQITAG